MISALAIFSLVDFSVLVVYHIVGQLMVSSHSSTTVLSIIE